MNKEVVNLVLLMLFVVFGSLFFASKQFISAQVPTNPNTAPITTTNTQQTPSSISQNTNIILGTFKDPAPDSNIISTNTASTDLSIIPREDYGTAADYLNIQKGLTNTYHSNFKVNFTLNASPDNGEKIFSTLLSPTADLSKLSLPSGSTADFKSKISILSNSDLTNSFFVKDNKIGLSQSQTLAALLDTTDLKGQTSQNNFTVTPSNKVQFPHSSFVVSDAETARNGGGTKTIGDGSPIVFDAQNVQVYNTGDFSDLLYKDVLSTNSLTTPSSNSYPYSSNYQSSIPVLIPKISKTSTYPINDFILSKPLGGQFEGSITNPNAFANQDDLNKFYTLNGLNNPNKIIQDKLRRDFGKTHSGYENVNGGDSGGKMLSEVFKKPGEENTWFECRSIVINTGYACPAQSYKANFIKSDPSLYFSFSPGVGYAGGDAGWVNTIDRFNTFQNEYKPEVFSQGNFYNLGTYTVNIDMKLSNCVVEGGCGKGISIEPIKSSLGCFCGEFNKSLANFAIGSEFSTVAGSGKTTNIPQNIYNYATNASFTYGYSSLNTTSLSRNLNPQGFPYVHNYYNPVDVVNINTYNGDLVPLNQRLGEITNHTDYKINYDSRLRGVGGLVQSHINPNTYYGIVPMYSDMQNDKAPKNYIAYEANTANLTDSNQISAIEISNVNGLNSKNTAPIFLPQGAINTYVPAGCNSIQNEIFSVLFSSTDPTNSKNINSYFTTFANTDTLPGDIGQRASCSNFSTKGLLGFASSNNWSKPIIGFKRGAITTPNDNQNSQTDQDIIMTSQYDNQDQNTGTLLLLYGYNNPIGNSTNTRWFSYNPSSPDVRTPIDMDKINNDLTRIEDNNSNNYQPFRFNITQDLGIAPGLAYNYKLVFGKDGTKYLIAAVGTSSAKSNKVIVYKWSTLYPTASDLKPMVFNISQDPNQINYVSNTTDRSKLNIQYTSLGGADVDPKTGFLGIGLNMTVIDSTSLPDTTITYNIPTVIQETSYGFMISRYDVKESINRWSDVTPFTIDNTSKPIVNPTIQELKWSDNGTLFGFINMTPNMSRISNILRDMSGQALIKCTDSNSISSYTRFISANGKPNCTNYDTKFSPSLNSTNDPIYGSVLSIDDYLNSQYFSQGGKKAGLYAKSHNVNEISTANYSDNSGTPGTGGGSGTYVNYIPSDPQEVAKWYLHSTPQPTQTEVNNIEKSFTYEGMQKFWDILWPYAVKIAPTICISGENKDGKCTHYLDPEMVMAWYWREIQFNIYAENCNDISTDINKKANVNRIAYPCNINPGIWQNAAYQMTDHDLLDYNKALSFDSSQSLQSIGSTVISNSLKLITDTNSIQRYQNISTSILPNGLFPKINSFDDIFKNNGPKSLDINNLFYLAILGKDPAIATYMNAKTLASDRYVDYNNQFYAASNWMPYFYAVHDEILNYNKLYNSNSNLPGNNLSPTQSQVSYSGRNINLISINSPSYINLLNNVSKDYNNIPVGLLLTVKFLETTGQTEALVDDKYAKAAGEMQIGKNGKFGETIVSSGSVPITGTYGKSAKISFPDCLRNLNPGSIDMGPFELNSPGTWESVMSKITPNILKDYPDRLADNGNKLDQGYSANACDIVDSMYAAAEVLTEKSNSWNCGSSWSASKIYCILAAYNGAANTPFKSTVLVNQKSIQIDSPLTGIRPDYAALGLQIYDAYMSFNSNINNQ